ncbi:MAG: PHP domain-containing protein [Chloroflexi bacterium]|nr:PHP domain-containing protein [Chloroflexota bacterium]
MGISEEVLSLPLGAVWLKADLHVHTPASRDIAEKWKGSTAEDVIKIAIQKGLDMIAITDHNTAEFCDAATKASAGTGLTVFPGIEISTAQGHVLAVFDVGSTGKNLEDFLITLGFKREQFGVLDAATGLGIVEVCDAIEKAGGIAIAAHIDARGGFLEMIKVGDERKKAYMASGLRALEIRNTASREAYQRGVNAPYPRKLACIQSSDSIGGGLPQHDLNSIGSVFSMLKMDDRSLAGLKLALIDPEMRIRLPGDPVSKPNKVILGMWVTGGFLDGQKFRLNENVNCFIGDTGAGKSVALELLRFGLNQGAAVEKIQKEVKSLLTEQLGNLNTVHILIAKGDSRYLVERSWGDPASDPVVTRLQDGKTESVEGSIDMHLFFPIKAFSQSEIIEFAREAEVRLSLTDDLIDFTTQREAISEVKIKLRENAAKIQTEEAKASNIRGEVAELPTLIEAVSNIDKVLTDPSITNHQVWYEEKALFGQASDQFGSLLAQVGSPFSFLKLSVVVPEQLDKYPNKELIEEIKTLSGLVEQLREELEKEAKEKLTGLAEKMLSLKDKWNERFTQSEAEYKKLLATIDTDGKGLEALSEKRRVLQERIGALQARKSELETSVQPSINKLVEERNTLLTNLQDQRKAITEKREQKAKELSEKLDHKIRLKVHARSNRSPFRTNLAKLGGGSGLRDAEYDTIADKCHPVSFVRKLLTQDTKGLETESGVAANRLLKIWENVVDRKRLDQLYELQLTDVDDVIEVMLRVGREEYKPIEELAHGQKCMVVLMVALAEGDFPLIVDQPEDALHAPGIEEGIVSTMRSRRGIRQCVFATRNANIIVSADAEQIFALKSDAHRGALDSCGCLDRFKQKELVIYHVEGGPEAFKRRQRIYFLTP